MKRFEDHAKTHKKLYRRLKVSVFTLTALSTVLASVALYFPASRAFIALMIVALNASAALLTSYEGLRKPRELWVNDQTTALALHDLERVIEYKIACSKFGLTESDGCFDQMQSLVSSSGKKWNVLVTLSSEQSKELKSASSRTE